MATALHARGMPVMAARVLVAVVCQDAEAVTARQLGIELQVSPAAVSGALRYLRGSGVLVRAPVPGSRREHYRLAPGGALEALLGHRTATAAGLAELAAQGIGVLGGPHTPGGARLAELAEFAGFVEEQMRAARAQWAARRAAPPPC
jgi:DNA-binding transcriptional ArsR family regulator